MDECKPLVGGGLLGAGVLHTGRGEAVQVDPIKPILKPPGTKHLQLKRDIVLSTFAFKYNLRRCTVVSVIWVISMVERCRLTLSNPS